MSIFGRHDEKPEEHKPEQGTEQPLPEQPPNQEPKQETPEEVRERSAIKMLITMYPDTQELRVENIQNLTRGLAVSMVERVVRSYNNEDTANAVMSKLAMLVQSQGKEKDKNRIFVPGLGK
jgi:hypothetical protein